MYKKIAFLIVFTLLIIVNSNNKVIAAKKRVKGRLPVAVGYSSAKLRTDRRAVFVTFLNLGNVKQVAYSLTYNANGIDQGAGGTIIQSGQPSIQRELLFATCSKGVCTYHYNITGMTLSVVTTTKFGIKSTKTYRIKP